MSNFAELLIEGAKSLGINLESSRIWMFETYTAMLIDWNRRINLTSITDPCEIAVKHHLDSLMCILADIPSDAKVIDVGTGAGFPGLPLKIVRPDIDLTMLDATKKKLVFLDAVCSELGFLDVQLVHGRAEEIGRDKNYRETYDIVLSRAVTEMRVLSEYCLPLAKLGGLFIAQKGPDVKEELEEGMNSMEILGGYLKKIIYEKAPMSEYKRTLVLIKKKSPTSYEYPRTQAKISRQPL